MNVGWHFRVDFQTFKTSAHSNIISLFPLNPKHHEPDDDDYKEDDDLERSIDDDDSDSPCDAASTSAECGVLQLGTPECYWDDDDEECKYDDGRFATW